MLSNYGDTVDYNVVATSTSEAAALFTGFISANGMDSVKGVLNQGLIYATDYKGDVTSFKEVDFKGGKSVIVETNSDVKVTVTDMGAETYHVYHVTAEDNEILVPEKDSVHIDVCTEDEFYSMESIGVLDVDGNVIAEPEIHIHLIGSERSNVRNGFFDVSGKDLVYLAVNTLKQEFPVSIYDEPSGKRYFESGLCSNGDCLNDHIRHLAPNGYFHTPFCEDETCTHDGHEHYVDENGNEVFRSACGLYKGVPQLCEDCIKQFAEAVGARLAAGDDLYWDLDSPYDLVDMEFKAETDNGYGQEYKLKM